MQGIENIILTANDGAQIKVITYNLESIDKKGVVIISHGFGEHSGSYIDLAERLWENGYASVIPDQRGHGIPPDNTTKWYGIIPDYQCFIDDIILITGVINEKTPGTPIALYGHSMGGNITANTLLSISPDRASSYSCAVLESPWLELYKPLSPFTVCVIKMLNHITPNFIIKQNLNHNEISSDTEKSQGYSKDPYYHGFISIRMITGIMNGCSFALDNASKLPVKTFLAYAENELIVNNNAILEFVDKAGDKVIVKKYASNHAIHNDVKSEEFCKDMIAFLDENMLKRNNNR